MPASFRMIRSLPSLIAVLLLLPGLVWAQRSESGMRTSGGLTGQTPAHVLDGSAIKVEHYGAGKMLRLAISLRPPHPVEEAAFLDEVQDPKSASFHHFLSAEEWNERFGPTVEDEKAVIAWAETAGLKVTHRYNSRLVVDVEAPAGTIEEALHVTLNSYKEMLADGTLSEAKYSNDRDPMVPSQLSLVVQAVHGLNSFEHMDPASAHGRPVPAGPDYVAGPVVSGGESAQADAGGAEYGMVSAVRDPVMRGPVVQDPVVRGTPVQTSAPTNYYQPIEIYSPGGYNYQGLQALGHCCNPLGNANNSPKESTIAIASYGDVSFSDLAAYQKGFPYLAYNVQKFYIDGTYPCNGTADPNCLEVTLDTEWSLTTANSFGTQASTAKIVVYEGVNTNTQTIVDLYNQVLHDNTTRVMSTSWSCPEKVGCDTAYMDSIHNVLSSLVGQGWTVVGDSADQGATGACSDALIVNFPASDPNVVAAGGTVLQEYTDTLGFVSEVAWTGATAKGSCAKNSGGSTGGFSSYYKVPSYQSGLNFTYRSVPDLALNANVGQDIYFSGGWTQGSGTSIVAPELAGFFAQENAYLLTLGASCGVASNKIQCSPLGNPLYAIYNEGKNRKSAHYPFYDVTAGCNSNDITALYNLTAYCAKTGIDQVTGWGSANMLQLAWAINYWTVPGKVSPTVQYYGPTLGRYYSSNENVNFQIMDHADVSGDLATGIAGYTMGWDSIPADAGAEATPAAGGTVNSFYSGPQYPGKITGCLGTVAGASCGSSVSEGCHTMHVRGWNNLGLTTGDTTFGPLCMDYTAPVVNASVSGTAYASGWYTTNATITLSATDALSGVAYIYYALNNPACTPAAFTNCSIYKNPITISAQGTTNLYFFARDNAGNSSVEQVKPIMLDNVAPVTTVSYQGTVYGAGYKAPLVVTLTGTDASSGIGATYYSLDINFVYASLYTGPITVTAPGDHTLYYQSVDVAGNNEALKTATFTVAPTSVTTLTASPNPASSNQPVTLTATVTDNVVEGKPNHYPSGTVTFLIDAQNLVTVPLNSVSVATLSIQLAAGKHSVTATYDTGTAVAPSVSSAVSVQVVDGGLPTTTRVFTTITNGTVGQTTAITGHVSNNDNPSVPATGSVTFVNTVNGVQTLIGPYALTNGSATATYNESYAGVNVITAFYTPSSNVYAASVDATGQTITVAAATPTEYANTNDQTVETNVASTLTIIFSYPGQVPPSGAMTVMVNGVVLPGTPACTYKTGGTTPHANCSLSYTTALPPGQYPLVYSVAADGNYAGMGGTSTLTVVP